MNIWMQTIGKLLIAIALIVVPFSMSHASMGIQSQDVHQSHVTHDDHISMGHGDLQETNNDHESQPYNSHHEGHDTANCCSSICGGALAIEFENSNYQPVAGLKPTHFVDALEPGEWVPPFRPPST